MRQYRVDPNTGQRKVAIIQAEDELAAIGMVFGAGWAGARAMTSTSGPGLSLMAEFAGLGYFAELPGVIFDVQRAGPSTGLPTRTMQGDLAFAYTLSHGDTKHIVLLPATVREATSSRWSVRSGGPLSNAGLRAERSRLGHELWLTKPLPYPEKPFDRGKVLSADDLNKVEVVGSLPRRRSRRYSLPHAAGHRALQRRLFHARHRSRRTGALLRAPRRLAA